MANKWIFISCPLHRVISGQSNSAISKSVFQNFSCTQTLSRVKSTKINPYTNMKQNIYTHTHATQILEELVAPIIIAFVSVWSFLLLAFYIHLSNSFISISHLLLRMHWMGKMTHIHCRTYDAALIKNTGCIYCSATSLMPHSTSLPLEW